MSLYTKGVAAITRAVIRAGVVSGPVSMPGYPKLSPPPTELPEDATPPDSSPANINPDPGPSPVASPVTNADTIHYQERTIAKELLLVEKHLQEGCRIDGKPCDCCLKHTMTLEALAEETLGMTGDGLYKDIRDWASDMQAKTTAEANASGNFNDEYPKQAMTARVYRKKVVEKALS